MLKKIGLTEEQKLYLIKYYEVPFEYLKKHLELINRNESMWPWELCTGSRSLGGFFSNYVIDQLTARNESKVRYSDLINLVSPRDTLQGEFNIWIEGERKKVNEIIINDYYDERLNTGDIKEGARYYYQRQKDGTYRAFIIVRP